jgi:hypothetical protein
MCRRLEARALLVTDSFKPQELSNFLWAMARLKLQPSAGLSYRHLTSPYLTSTLPELTSTLPYLALPSPRRGSSCSRAPVCPIETNTQSLLYSRDSVIRS